MATKIRSIIGCTCTMFYIHIIRKENILKMQINYK